jgi:hypothetical protein
MNAKASRSSTGCTEGPDGQVVPPALVGGADEAVDQQGHASRGGQGAGDVEAAAVPFGLADVQRGEYGDQHADRHVDEEHPSPVEPLGEHASRQEAYRAAARGDGGEDAEGTVPLRPFGERGGDQRQRGRRRDRAPHALQDTGGQQLPGLLGETAEQRGEGEQQDAGHEDPAAPEDVTCAAAQKQQAAEGERVGADDPCEVGGAELESVLNVWQRDVHNRRVQYHHELADGDDGERDSGTSFPACRTWFLILDQLRGCHYGSPTSALVDGRVHCCVNGSESPVVNASVH